MSEYEMIEVRTENRVGYVTLNRPKALNALSEQLVHEIAEATIALDRDENIGAIVITGSEKAFAAGADIKEMSVKNYTEVAARGLFEESRALDRMRTPLIAAVSGYALGGGCELAMSCDIIVAAESAKFGQPEITLGIIPGLGGTQRLPRAIGAYKAADLVLTGRTIDAAEAERIGLVSRVVPDGELLSTATELAETIAAKSLPAIYAAKAALKAAQEGSLSAGLSFESQAAAGTFALEDQTEGMTAFAEKRKPHFQHR